MAVMLTPAGLRLRFNLPSEVPDAFLEEHLEAGLDRMARDTGLGTAPTPTAEASAYSEAVAYATLASALPWLHVFYLQGASPALRLADNVDMRFLTPEETRALIEVAEREYQFRVAFLTGSALGEPVGGFVYGAI